MQVLRMKLPWVMRISGEEERIKWSFEKWKTVSVKGGNLLVKLPVSALTVEVED